MCPLSGQDRILAGTSCMCLVWFALWPSSVLPGLSQPSTSHSSYHLIIAFPSRPLGGLFLNSAPPSPPKIKAAHRTCHHPPPQCPSSPSSRSASPPSTLIFASASTRTSRSCFRRSAMQTARGSASRPSRRSATRRSSFAFPSLVPPVSFQLNARTGTKRTKSAILIKGKRGLCSGPPHIIRKVVVCSWANLHQG